MDETPFSISPNPNSLYLTPQLRAALVKTKITIEQRQGLTCVLGDNGLGKSSFLRFVFAEYTAREDVKTTLITTPNFSSEFAMLKSVSMDFGILPKRSLLAQQEALQGYLMERYQAGENVIIFIDEAQKLTNKMLEQVRSLLNFETHLHKLVQIVMAGQLELYTRLLTDANKALRSRIIAATMLSFLTREEMDAMVDHRCRVAAVPNPFPDTTLARIYEISTGVPRDALKLCLLSYEMMKMTGEREVNIEMLDAVYQEGVLQPA